MIIVSAPIAGRALGTALALCGLLATTQVPVQAQTAAETDGSAPPSADLAREITAELDAWERYLDEIEATPAPAGSRQAVEDEIERLRSNALPPEGDALAAIVREAARAWVVRAAPVGDPLSQLAPEPTIEAAVPKAEAPISPQADLSGSEPEVAFLPPEADLIRQEPEPALNEGNRPPFPPPAAQPGRVLTLPGAATLTEGGEIVLPPFTILYRHGEANFGGRAFYAVGETRDSVSAWIPVENTEEWRSMLVMQYAPMAGRERVLFFREPNDLDEVLKSHWGGPDEARALYQNVAQGRFDRDRIIAIEPARPVSSEDRPYFMPIIGFRKARFENDPPTTAYLLQLAAVTLKSNSRTQTGLPDPAKDAVDETKAVKEFRAGIVFVVDSTISMGPYIEEVQSFLKMIRREADRIAPGLIDFGLIGYRDNVSPDSNIEYVTRTFLPLGTPAGSDFEAAVDRIEPSRVSTRNWREDAFAGLQDAIEATDWRGYDARFVILVTDAGPRDVGDALARDATLGARSIGRMAERRGISLNIMHMLTEAGKDDHLTAQARYSEVARSLGESAPRYWVLTGEAPRQFGVALNSTGIRILENIETIAGGRLLTRKNPFSNDVIIGDLLGSRAEIGNDEEAERVGDVFAEQFFVFQQEYLGRLEGDEAPDFYRAWVADRDLVNPGVESMQVKVLVTRNQLSDLAARLSDIVSQLRQKEMGTQDAFERIAGLAGLTAYDPSLSVAQMLPEYLADLPYGSRFMTMTATQWSSLIGQQQTEILNDVSDRIRLLQSVNSSSAGWLRLPGRDPGDQVYPLDLDDLP